MMSGFRSRIPTERASQPRITTATGDKTIRFKLRREGILSIRNLALSMVEPSLWGKEKKTGRGVLLVCSFPDFPSFLASFLTPPFQH